MNIEGKKINPLIAKYREFSEMLTRKVGVAGKKAIFSGAALILIFAAFSLYLGSTFFSGSNITNLLQQIVTYAIIGYGLTFCLICGGTDLSAGSSMCLVGIIVLSALINGIPWPVAFILAILFGILMGIINGFSIEILGVVPFIATLGTQWVFRGVAGVITNGTPLYTVDIANDSLRTFFEFIGSGRWGGVPISVFITAIYGVVMYFILAKTRIGRQIYACGSNLEAAKLSGINAVGTRMFAYCMSGVSAAICGIIVTSRLQSAQTTAGTGVELEAIAAAVVGGVSNNGGEGSIINTIIGALIMGTLKNGLNISKVNSYYQQVIIGIILVGACALEVYRHKKSTR